MPEAPLDASFGCQAGVALASECAAATSLSLRDGSRPAPAAVDGTASMKDLVWRRIGDRGVRPDLVVPALEPRQRSAKDTVLERDHFVCKSFFFEGSDEALFDGNAAMPANCAEPGANVVVVAPFEIVLAELGALVADGVLRRASSTPGRLVKHKADLVVRGAPLENSKARGTAGRHMAKFGGPVHHPAPARQRWPLIWTVGN
jgi:hypothetical protein